MTQDELNAIKARMVCGGVEIMLAYAPADLRTLVEEVEELRTYLNKGIEVFASPCDAHSGANTPPFREFFERYGSRCVICLVDEAERTQATIAKWEAECNRLSAKSESVPQLLRDIERMDGEQQVLKAEVERLREVVGQYERLVRGDCDLCADKDTPIKALPCCECWDKPSRPNWRPIFAVTEAKEIAP
jgi:hypothetical protein